MSASFLHGIETIEQNIGPVPITIVKSSVIGLVGAAPRWAVSGSNPVRPPSGPNVATLVNSIRGASGFGPLIQGWPIPYALNAIFQQGAGQVIVIDVWDPAKHFSDVVGERTFNSAGAINLGQMGILSLAVMANTTGSISDEADTFAGTPQTIQLAHGNVKHGTLAIVPAAAADWAATHAYALNAVIKPSSSNTGGFYFKATTAGTSGSSEPVTWDQTIGGTVTDGGVTWTNVGLSPYVENTDYSVDYRTGLVSAISTGLLTSDEAVDASYDYYSASAYVLGTDYTADMVNGVVNVKSGGAITSAETVAVSFSYADPSKVTDADIIGAVTDGVYTGIQALLPTYNSMGFFAKILCAPGYSQNEDVQAALDTMAGTIRAIALIDSAPNTQVATAISNRSTSGQAFATSSGRCYLLFPNQQFTDSGIIPTGVTLDTNGAAVQANASATADSPFSQWVAGPIAAVDIKQGYWYSPSNHEITGILGPDVPIYASPVDSNSDTNNLNAAGIATIFNAFGTGLRLWGNRLAAYPSSTEPVVFVPIRRVLDVLEESVQQFAMQFLDQPITPGMIDAVVESVNGLIRTLICGGALVAGSSCSFNPAENPATQIAAGQVVFDLDLMPPPPAERITFNVYVDTNLLANIAQNLPSGDLGTGAAA